LTSAAAFRQVFRRGVRLDGRFFLLIAITNDRGHDRVGLAVGKRVGGAVVRNAAKRRLREAFRKRRARPGPGWDIVFVAKPDIAGTAQEELEREFGQRLRRLAGRQPPGPRASPAPSG
jgi:ribonuclease P protein component